MYVDRPRDEYMDLGSPSSPVSASVPCFSPCESPAPDSPSSPSSPTSPIAHIRHRVFTDLYARVLSESPPPTSEIVAPSSPPPSPKESPHNPWSDQDPYSAPQDSDTGALPPPPMLVRTRSKDFGSGVDALPLKSPTFRTARNHARKPRPDLLLLDELAPPAVNHAEHWKVRSVPRKPPQTLPMAPRSPDEWVDRFVPEAPIPDVPPTSPVHLRQAQSVSPVSPVAQLRRPLSASAALGARMNLKITTRSSTPVDSPEPITSPEGSRAVRIPFSRTVNRHQAYHSGRRKSIYADVGKHSLVPQYTEKGRGEQPKVDLEKADLNTPALDGIEYYLDEPEETGPVSPAFVKFRGWNIL